MSRRERWRRWMRGAPFGLKYDVLDCPEMQSSIRHSLIHKRLRSCHIDGAALDKRAFHVVHAHGAGAQFVNACEIRCVGEQIMASRESSGRILETGSCVAHI